MRKILSILIALGMVLALSTMAVPAAAGTFPPCGATVTLVSNCAGNTSCYTINFTADHTLLPANDKISVDFDAGTDLTSVTKTDVTVNGTAVDSVAISGTHIEFPVPAAMGIINVGDKVTVTICKVVNPSTAGAKSLTLDVNLLCCGPFAFDCGNYTIIPATSTYGCEWDSGPTYPGIAKDFVPPFKACGQETFPGLNLTGKWANNFTLLVLPTVIGCASPCASAMNLTLNLTAAPAGSNVTISINGTVFNPVKGTAISVGGPFTLGANTTLNFSNAVHFDTVGDYTLCFSMTCPAGSLSCYTDPPCVAGAQTLFECCYDVEVYQWKEAAKIELARKWNLISLPLVPLNDGSIAIADALEACADEAEIVSIHYYDRCADAWSVWGNGQTSLSTLEDGKAYWVKVDYTLGSATKGPGLPIAPLWVWGTSKPVPPAGPSAYAVCDGWNMIGFTEGDPAPATADQDQEYLWNFVHAGPLYDYGAVYGWKAATQTWDTPFAPGTVTMVPGKGYWVAFSGSGAIYPP